MRRYRMTEHGLFESEHGDWVRYEDSVEVDFINLVSGYTVVMLRRAAYLLENRSAGATPPKR